MYHKLLLAIVSALGICTLGATQETKPEGCKEKQPATSGKKGEYTPPCTCVRFELFDFDSYVMYYAEWHDDETDCTSPSATYYNGDPGITEQTCSTTEETCIKAKVSLAKRLTDADVFTGFSPALYPDWTFQPTSDRVTVIRKPDAQRFVQLNVKYKDQAGKETTISPIVKMFTVVVDPADTLKTPPEVVPPTLHYLAVQVSRLPNDYPQPHVPQVEISATQAQVLQGGKALSLNKENPWGAPVLLLLSAR